MRPGIVALYTNCIYSSRESTHGIRISVMSRHTENDGVTPDPRITPDKYDEHLTDLAPAPKWLGDIYRRGRSWEEFEQRYRASLQGNPALAAMAKRAMTQDITILCKEATPERCHRRIIAEELRKLFPDLEIVIE